MTKSPASAFERTVISGGRRATREPGGTLVVTKTEPAHHALRAEDGAAPEDGGVRVDRHAVLHRRVALRVADHPAALVARDRESAERHPLVELDVRADRGRLADHDARRVVDEEAPADPRPGVDVGAAARVGPLAHDARHERHPHDVQLVGDAVDGHRQHPRVGEDHLVEARGRGVAVVGGLHVVDELVPHRGEAREERGRDAPGLLRAGVRRPGPRTRRRSTGRSRPAARPSRAASRAGCPRGRPGSRR